MSIHPTAVIEDGAELGGDVSVGPYSYIQRGARVGDGCRVGPHVTIYGYTTLGPNCRVHAGAVLGDTPQDLAFEEQESFVKIGARCTLREGVTVHRGTKPGSTTSMGDDCFLMAFSHLGHNTRMGNRVIMANGVLLGGYVEVGDGVFFGGYAAVHQFCRIGRLAMVGGAASISQDVPPFCTATSAVLNQVSGLNTVGLRRAGMSPAERSELKQAFHLLYFSGLRKKEAVEQILAQCPSEAAAEFCEFVMASKRGVCHPLARGPSTPAT